MKKTKIRAIEETDIGIYVWKFPGGGYLDDGAGNFLNIPARKGDLTRTAALREHAYGAMREAGLEPCGSPEFLSGRRRVSEEEFRVQSERMACGMDPEGVEVDDRLMKDVFGRYRRK